MKTDNIVKSWEIHAYRQSSFIFPKALSVSHRNNMKGGIKVPKTCTSSTASGNHNQQIRHGCVATGLSPGGTVGGHPEYKMTSNITPWLHMQIASLMSRKSLETHSGPFNF